MGGDLGNDLLRDGVIQRFEYTFELAWKMLKRRIEIDVGNSEEVDSYSKRQLFRVGGERGLIDDVESWFDSLEKRNLTSHTYEGATAAQVASVIERFSGCAGRLLEKLKERNAKD